MAALPSGWADTGIVEDLTVTFDLEIKAQAFGSFRAFYIDRFDFTPKAAAGASDLGHTGLWSGTPAVFGTSYDAMEVEMFDNLTSATTIVATGSGAASGDPAWMSVIPIVKTWENLRLGVTWEDGALVYGWFSDVASLLTLTIDGSVALTVTGTDPPTRVGGPVIEWDRGVVDTDLVAVTGQSTYDHARITNIVGDGQAMTAPASTSYKMIAASTTPSPFGPRAFNVACPWRYTSDLAAVDADGTSEAVTTTHEGAIRTCPTNYAVQADAFHTTLSLNPFLERSVPAATADGTWLAAQTVAPYTADRTFQFLGQDPADPNDATPTDTDIGTVTIDDSISILRSANAWTITGGSGAVGGTTTVPIFTIASGPATVSRDLLSYWREWNTVGDPDYQGGDDRYTTTKSDYYGTTPTPDIWGASLYRYLDLDMTVPAGSDTDAVLTVTWAIPFGTDTSAGGLPSVTINTIVTTYPVATFPANGRSVQRIDLMSPTSGSSRPFYGERIDSFTIGGLEVGVTTVHAMTLVTDEQSYARFGGRAHANGDGSTAYPGVVISQDGAAPALLYGRSLEQSLFGDTDLNDDTWRDYRDDNQNGRFLTNGTGRSLQGTAPGMRGPTLSDVFTALHRIEGITAVYDGTDLDTAFTDVLDTDPLPHEPVVYAADWFKPTVPSVRLTPGSAYTVRGWVVASGVSIPPGVDPANMRIFQRLYLGATAEMLVTDDTFAIQGAGVAINLRAYTGGAPTPADTLLGSGTTDASGYAEVPHRTGTIGGAEMTAYPTEN